MRPETLIGDDRLHQLVNLINKAPEGLCAELGVYKGGSLVHMAMHHEHREFWGFDTFTGLPAKDYTSNEIHKPGEFDDTSYEYVKSFTDKYKNITLIPGYFPTSMPLGSESIRFAFVHVDCDYYEGVKNAIHEFWPLLKPGGIIVFDDFGWGNCPGVEQAIRESGYAFYDSGAEYQVYMQKPKY